MTQDDSVEKEKKSTGLDDDAIVTDTNTADVDLTDTVIVDSSSDV